MADREEYQAGRVGGGISSFQGTPLPSAGQVRALDFSNISNALAGWQDKLFQEREAEVMEQLSNEALEAQNQMGVAGIANPDRDLAARYAQQYQKSAEALYLQQLSVDALKMDTQLQQQYRFDPDGYQQAWNEYTENTIGGLEKENRRMYTASRAILQEQGARSWAGISNAAFQRQEIENQATALRNTEETLDVYADRMRNPEIDNLQRDIEYSDGISAVMANLNGLLETGVINGAEYDRERRNAEDILRTEWVSTNFRAAMERGDLSAARSYITELRQGAWFINNEKADQLAARLESTIPNMDAARRKQLMNLARAEASMLSLGVEPTPDVAGSIQRNINWHAQNDPENLVTAMSIQSGLKAKQIADQIEEMGSEALIYARNVFLQDSTIPESERAALAKAIDDKIARVDAAARTGNRQALRDEFAERPVEWIAQNWNVSPDVLPVASTQQVVEAYQRARNTGNGVSELDAVLEEATIRGATAGDLVHTALEAAKNGTMESAEAASFSMAVLARASGVPNLADRALFDGDFVATDPTLVDLDFMKRLNDDKVYQTIQALSMGNPQARTALHNALNNMFRAEVARGAQGAPSNSEQRRAADAITRELSSIPITNIRGSFYPTSIFGSDDSPNMRDETIRQITQQVRTLEEETGMHQRIVPDGTGTFNIYAGQSDAILLATLTPSNTEEERDQARVIAAQNQDYAQQELSDPTWLRSYVEELPTLQAQTQRAQFSASITKAARKHNVPVDDARRFAIAVMQSPEEERGGRLGQLAIPEAALYIEQRTDARFRPGRPEQLEEATNDKAIELYSELRKIYDDEQKALAAYWVGQDTVDEFVNIYGDAWLQELPTPGREFVYRALDADVNNMGYVPADETLLGPRPERRLRQPMNIGFN